MTGQGIIIYPVRDFFNSIVFDIAPQSWAYHEVILVKDRQKLIPLHKPAPIGAA